MCWTSLGLTGQGRVGWGRPGELSSPQTCASGEITTCSRLVISLDRTFYGELRDHNSWGQAIKIASSLIMRVEFTFINLSIKRRVMLYCVSKTGIPHIAQATTTRKQRCHSF